MQRIFRACRPLGFALALAGCATSAITLNYLPGDQMYYSVGTMQDQDYYAANIKRLQSSYPFYPAYRIWEEDNGKPEPNSRNMLRQYYPLSVRWELKDGRQFIAENIDIAGIMRDYLATNDIKMQWQVEDRPRTVGDFDPSLVYAVNDDLVVIKWLLRYNKVPLERRGSELPDIEFVQYWIATVKGTPTTDIDFNKQWEAVK
jgi:hypothetical protein